MNLAAPLADGEQVVVPKRRAAGAVRRRCRRRRGRRPPAPVQLSTATLEQLETLPGIGPVMAQKILDYRTKHGPFSSVDELDAVPGIGPNGWISSGTWSSREPPGAGLPYAAGLCLGIAAANLARLPRAASCPLPEPPYSRSQGRCLTPRAGCWLRRSP